MKSINKVELLPYIEKNNIDYAYKRIELIGRVCYNSEDKITPLSFISFVSRLMKMGHVSVLEHGYLVLHIDKFIEALEGRYKELKTEEYSNVKNLSKRIKQITKVLAIFKLKYDNDESDFEYGLANLDYIDGMRVFLDDFVIVNIRLLYELALVDEDHYVYIGLEKAIYRNLIEIIGKNMLFPITFRVETSIDISREFNRHRSLSVTERSTRYVDITKDSDIYEIMNIELSNEEMFDYDNYFIDLDKLIDKLKEKGYKKEIVRKVYPLATKTIVYYTGFPDDMNNVINTRIKPDAHPDAIDIAKQMKELLGNR